MNFKQKFSYLALALALPVVAAAGDMGTVYGQLSTNGLGIGYATSIKDDWALRGQLNYFKRGFSGDIGDFGDTAKLNVDLNLQSIQLLADWYPTTASFRLSGGLVINNNKVTLAGTGKVSGKDATVNGELKLSDSISPYLGLGYATRPKDAKGLGFNFDLGALFQSPKVTLTATGVSAALTQPEIDSQLKKMQDAADKLKVFPVIGLGISYAF